MPHPPTRHDHALPKSAEEGQLPIDQRQSVPRERLKVPDDGRKTPKTGRRRMVDTSRDNCSPIGCWRVKKPLPTCLFLAANRALFNRVRVKEVLLSVLCAPREERFGRTLVDAGLCRTNNARDTKESDKSEIEEEKEWLLFACCVDIGCQNTNNQYSRRRGLRRNAGSCCSYK